ncbi:MAG: hypothetical protein ACREN5_15995 [Gemmatimonadales bacterium]
MRVLRLSNSEDSAGDLPPQKRPWRIAGDVLAAAAGEPVETTVRVVWPDPSLPDLVDRWLDRYGPDMVFLKVNWYWYGYESVPLRLRRRVPVLGRPLAAAGDGTTRITWLARTRGYKAARHLANRVIGGDANFTCDEVIERMQAVIKRIVAREDIILVVKGTGGGRDAFGALGPYYQRFVPRREYVEGAIEAHCAELGVHYTSIGRLRTREEADIDRGDGVHKGERGLGRVGVSEGNVMVQAWEAERAGSRPIVHRA